MRIELIHPKELGVNEAARWRAVQATSADLASPYLTPDWARLVGEAREDARICVINHGAAFFPAQRLSRFTAMGLGAPIADYQGLIAPPDFQLDPAALCRSLKVGRVDLTHVPPAHRLFRAAGKEGSWIVDVSGGGAAYREGLKERRGEFLRQQLKKERKFAREQGELTFAAEVRDLAQFEIMLGWKLAQLKRTGQPAIWVKPWVRTVLEGTFASADPGFSGVLCTLSAGGKLVAANYFLRAGDVLHDWIMAHDDDFNAYSPGVALARMALEWAGDQGFREVDFGPGSYQYKRQLSTGQRMLAYGAISAGSWSGAVRALEHRLRRQIERLPNPRLAALPGKAMRRWDLMRSLEA